MPATQKRSVAPGSELPPGNSSGRRTPPGLTAADVITLTGCTYRQLDYWHTTGYLPEQREHSGRGSGNWRVYSPEAVEAVRRLVELTRAGISHNAADRALRDATDLSDGYTVTLAPGVYVHVTRPKDTP